MRDRLDQDQHDSAMIEEIDELTNLIIAASQSPSRLTQSAIDSALEVTPTCSSNTEHVSFA